MEIPTLTLRGLDHICCPSCGHLTEFHDSQQIDVEELSQAERELAETAGAIQEGFAGPYVESIPHYHCMICGRALTEGWLAECFFKCFRLMHPQ